MDNAALPMPGAEMVGLAVLPVRAADMYPRFVEGAWFPGAAPAHPLRDVFIASISARSTGFDFTAR